MKMELSSSFNLLPDEVKVNIFGYLPFIDVVNDSRVCKEWQKLLDDKSIWIIFYKKIIEFPFKNKAKFIKKLSLMVDLTKESEPKETYKIFISHIFLARLGISTLDKAQQYIEKESDKKNEMCWWMVEEYLKQNLVTEAEKILEKINDKARLCIEEEYRKAAIYAVFNRYLKMEDFDKALSMNKYFKIEKGKSSRALSLLIWNAGQQNKIGIAVVALTKFSGKNSSWGSSVRDLYESLCEKKAIEVAETLKLLFPDAFIKEEEYRMNDLLHFIDTHRVERAKKVIFSNEDEPLSNYEKVDCLKLIKNAYSEEGKKEDKLRIRKLINQEIQRIGYDPTRIISL